MRLSNETDQEIIRSAISDSSAGILAFLSAMGGREAIAFGEAIATPMRMKFVEVDRAHQPCPSWLDAAAVAAAGPKEVDLRDIVAKMRGETTTPALREGPAMAGVQAGTPPPAARAPIGGAEAWPTFAGSFRLR